MATILIYPEVAQMLGDLIQSMLNGEFEAAQLTLTDKRGLPIDIVFQNDEEVEHD